MGETVLVFLMMSWTTAKNYNKKPIRWKLRNGIFNRAGLPVLFLANGFARFSLRKIRTKFRLPIKWEYLVHFRFIERHNVK